MVFMLLSTFLMGVAHFPPVTVPVQGGQCGEETATRRRRNGAPVPICVCGNIGNAARDTADDGGNARQATVG